MGTLPHQFRPKLAERPAHGPATHCATGVMPAMRADQDDRRKIEVSGGRQCCNNPRKIPVLLPRSPQLLIVPGAVISQYGPSLRAMPWAWTRFPHQENPCTRHPRCRGYEGFGPGLKIKALKTVGRPPAPVLYEDPNEAWRCRACHRVAAHAGAVGAEETLCCGHRGGHSFVNHSSTPSITAGPVNHCPLCQSLLALSITAGGDKNSCAQQPFHQFNPQIDGEVIPSTQKAFHGR